MKTGKKIIFSTIILIIFAAVVFFFGWIQFLVKPGNCAIMTSKTCGLYEKPVVPGVFTWRWERLLPTNVKLTNFSLSPEKTKQIVEGSLPGGELYAKKIETTADFSYKISMETSLSVTPENILKLYKENKIQNNEDLKLYLEQKSKSLSVLVSNYIFKLTPEDQYIYPKVLDSKVIKELCTDTKEFDDIQIISVEIISARIPDVTLYNKAKAFYDDYLKNVQSKIDKKTEEQALKFLEEERNLKQLEKFAELLKKYPELNDLVKNGDISTILKAIR